MNGELLLEAVGLIDDKFIAEAQEERHHARRVWVRWAAAAACLAVALTFAIPAILNGRWMGAAGAAKDEAPESSNDSAAPPEGLVGSVAGDSEQDGAAVWRVVLFDGGMYEEAAADDAVYGSANKTELDAAAAAGEYLGAGELASGGAVRLYAVAGSDSRATLVAQYEDGRFAFVRYCNDTDGAARGAGELLALYGAFDADALVKAELVDWNRDGTLAETTDKDWLAAFYAAYSALGGMDNDAYQRAVYGGLSEMQQQARSIEIADSLVCLRLSLANGERIYIDWYPEIGYLYQNMVYFKADAALGRLLNDLTDRA